MGEWTARLNFVESDIQRQEMDVYRGCPVDTKTVQEGKAKFVWLDGDLANKIASETPEVIFKCIKKHVDDAYKRNPPPFDTLSLQNFAINHLGLKGKQIDIICQNLYQRGYITYPRTDNKNISDEGYENLAEYAIANRMPVIGTKRIEVNKDTAQEAHECILPTDFFFDSSVLQGE